MTAEAVKDALEKLKTPQSASSKHTHTYFCYEDTFPSKDLKVSIKDIGQVPFPIKEEFSKKIITVSSKAKFGKGKATVLDTNVRDTQMIPESDLNVEIKDESFKNLLDRAAIGLNLSENVVLVPHLYNMLVYGPGQFFKLHRDSEKLENMVATLVIVLPSFHKGGDLIIQHNNNKHVFFGSQNSDFIKSVVFYSDCLHEIECVTEGYRIALTFNVVSKCSKTGNVKANDDDVLHDAIKHYFSPENEEEPEKIVYILSHSYSENNLSWDFLKGEDRTVAFALRAVAEKQNLVPCLAVGSYKKLCDLGDDGDYDEEVLIEDETFLNYWIDGENTKFEEKVFIYDSELCCDNPTDDSEPYKVKDYGPTGNEGNEIKYWYRRACVVLWSSKWCFSLGFKQRLCELYQMTLKENNKSTLKEEINKAKSYFYKVEYWKDPEIMKYLIEIVVYINDCDLAVSILSKLSTEFMQCGQLDYLIKLEKHFDEEKMWKQILEHWSKGIWRGYLENIPCLVEEYLKKPLENKRSFIINLLAEIHIDKYLSMNVDQLKKKFDAEFFHHYRQNVKTPAQILYEEFKMCIDLKNSILEDKLINHVIGNPVHFPPNCLVEVLALLQDYLTLELFSHYKCLKDAALKEILTSLSNSQPEKTWSLKNDIYCFKFDCDSCDAVKEFLNSDTIQKYTLKKAQTVRKHVSDKLKSLVKAHYLILSIDKSKTPHSLIIEKDKKVNEENVLKRQNKEAELNLLKKRLEDMSFFEDKVENIPRMSTGKGKQSSNIGEGNSSCPFKRQKKK